MVYFPGWKYERVHTDMKNKLGFVTISFRQPGVESETFLGYD